MTDSFVRQRCGLFAVITVATHMYILQAWASAHRGKWDKLTPLEKMDEKLKSENMQKRAVFYAYMFHFESSQGRQV